LTEKTIHYFRYINGRFKRHYATLISLNPHLLRIYTGNQEFVIRSDYNMQELLLGDVILGVVYKKKKDKVAKMYPLPMDLSEPFDDSKAQSVFAPMTEEERRKLLMTEPSIQKLNENAQKLQEQVNDALKHRADLMQMQVNFAEGIPQSLRINTPSPPPVMKATKKEESSNDFDFSAFCVKKSTSTKGLDRTLTKLDKKVQRFLRSESP